MTGGNQPGTFYRSAGGVGEHFVGYWFKYSNPYSAHPGTNKEWYPYAAAGDYYFCMQGDLKIWLITQFGTTTNWPSNVSNPTITLGAWHRLEIYYRPSASTIKWWIDGALAGNYTNVPGMVNSYEEWRFGPTWGGAGSSVAFDSYFWVDQVHISGR